MVKIQMRRSGYMTVGQVITALVSDMKDNGFRVVWPAMWTPPVGEAMDKFTVLLEAGGDVDPLNKDEVENKQPWRLRIEVFDKYTCGITAGSNLSLPDTGANAWYVVDKQIKGPLGSFGGEYTKVATGNVLTPDTAKRSEAFINRKDHVLVGTVDMSSSYPMSYYVVITDRGIFFTVWEDAASVDDHEFSWFLVQRPVQRKTGAVVTEGKAPVFAVVSTQNKINRFIVSESDVMRPSITVDATTDTDGYNAVINAEEQVAISEGNKYVVSFPSRLNTPRYAYTYELDMIGYTGADVISENTDVPLKIYGETEDRTYVSIHSNDPRNTKMRLLALKSEP